ncbi:hypothetical protein [Wenzhouxiangella sp. XN24]|uniref:hypothetical protein n=1 Tax=Wenzhouxiangella sp. XN24 TaxID=2713569 RepID=UPI0013EC068D|nr:hypothetical protein [Wenzhouxiangella sp. XN24]NGX16381.1 hypothetical protein [Wenzhouxiangella sp. XN24]
MPYPRAYLALLVLVPMIILAFWPGYFSRLGETPWTIHVHGVTASVWVLALIVQSWAIHRRQIGLHRTVGRATFVLVPVFIAGGLLVLQSMAQGTFGGTRPFLVMFGPGLGALDLLSVLFFSGFFYAALRHRRNVQLHARYMLATILLLVTPISSRLLNGFVPGLRIQGPEDMHLFTLGVHLGNAMALAVALGLYFGARRHGRPFLLAAVFLVASSICFQWAAAAGPWLVFFRALGEMPTAALLAVGLGLGALVVYLGWRGPPKGVGKPLAGPVPGS